MCALLHAVCSLLPRFSRDPLADIRWAMEECSSFLLTRAQEAHYLDIHQRHLVQVQHGPEAVALELCLQGLQMRRVQVADQLERRVVLVNLPFNLACPLRGRRPLTPGAMARTIPLVNYCRMCASMRMGVPNVRQLPNNRHHGARSWIGGGMHRCDVADAGAWGWTSAGTR
jgi:hypothetical protein